MNTNKKINKINRERQEFKEACTLNPDLLENEYKEMTKVNHVSKPIFKLSFEDFKKRQPKKD